MKATVEIDVNPAMLAAAFCELNDDDQAQFFIEVAAIAEAWDHAFGPSWQWARVGRHLATCDCSTDAARDLVQTIARTSSLCPCCSGKGRGPHVGDGSDLQRLMPNEACSCCDGTGQRR